MHQIFLVALDNEIVSCRNLKKEPVFGIKSKNLNLELFRRNYSSYNKIYMFLEYLITKRIFDFFSIVF